jgi:hypothetical protein
MINRVSRIGPNGGITHVVRITHVVAHHVFIRVSLFVRKWCRTLLSFVISVRYDDAINTYSCGKNKGFGAVLKS